MTAQQRRQLFGFLPQADSASATAAAPSNLFTETCDVYRYTTTKDTGGSNVLAFVLHLTGIPCRCQPKSGDVDVLAGRPHSSRRYNVYIAAGQDITERDRVMVPDGEMCIVNSMMNFDVAGRLVRLDCETVP
jgi:hypothetical protein